MNTNYKWLKHSNTGEIVLEQTFTDIGIKGIPNFYYDIAGKPLKDNMDLTGFVEITERKVNRIKRKTNK